MTEEQIMKKAIRVINSCQTARQAQGASRYAKLASDRFPGIYWTLREALTRVECNFSRIRRGVKPWPLVQA